MKTVIHVNQHVIKANRKRAKEANPGEAYQEEPPLTVKTYKDRTNAHNVIIWGASSVVYRPDKPLSCGAHVWIETHAEVEVVE